MIRSHAGVVNGMRGTVPHPRTIPRCAARDLNNIAAMERRKASALASSGRVPQGTQYDVAPLRRSIDPFRLGGRGKDQQITCLPAHGRKRGRRSFNFLCLEFAANAAGCLTSEE